MTADRQQFHYCGTTLDYLFRPGLWMGDPELLQLKRDLVQVNQLAGRPLQYGLFDADHESAQSIREFLGTANVCRIIREGHAIAYFYNVELLAPELKAVHGGLIVIGSNPGVDLLVFPYMLMVLLLYRRTGPFYITSITSVPAVIGSFATFLRNAWPSHLATCSRPPSREYGKVVELLEAQYVHRYFPPGSTAIDRRRFILTSPADAMGFETEARKLSRHPELRVNLFCLYWLDHSKGEDLIQVGRMTAVAAFKCICLAAYYRARGLLRLNRRTFVETPATPLNGSVVRLSDFKSSRKVA